MTGHQGDFGLATHLRSTGVRDGGAGEERGKEELRGREGTRGGGEKGREEGEREGEGGREEGKTGRKEECEGARREGKKGQDRRAEPVLMAKIKAKNGRPQDGGMVLGTLHVSRVGLLTLSYVC